MISMQDVHVYNDFFRTVVSVHRHRFKGLFSRVSVAKSQDLSLSIDGTVFEFCSNGTLLAQCQ